MKITPVLIIILGQMISYICPYPTELEVKVIDLQGGTRIRIHEDPRRRIPTNAAKAGTKGNGNHGKPRVPIPNGTPNLPNPSVPHVNRSQKSDGKRKKRCNKHSFWHIRGERCVPIWCQQGRDRDTGECFGEYGRTFGSSFHGKNYYRRTTYCKSNRRSRYGGGGCRKVHW